MNEYLLPIFSFTFGIGLGIFFFGGLWLTINRLPQSKRPELLTDCAGDFAGSLGNERWSVLSRMTWTRT